MTGIVGQAFQPAGEQSAGWKACPTLGYPCHFGFNRPLGENWGFVDSAPATLASGKQKAESFSTLNSSLSTLD